MYRLQQRREEIDGSFIRRVVKFLGNYFFYIEITSSVSSYVYIIAGRSQVNYFRGFIKILTFQS